MLDLLLQGGKVRSPETGAWRSADIGITGGQISSIADHIEPNSASVRVDIGGKMVLPGLIDMHVHAYDGATYWGIHVDDVCLRNGVTTYVDAGSAGPFNFDGLARTLRNSALRALAFLNIAPGGLVSPYGELLEEGSADVGAAVRVAREHPDLVIGFKIRASPNTSGRNTLQALEAVRRAADETGLRVMVHISDGPPDLEVILSYLRSGDILTHCFTPYDNAVISGTGFIRSSVDDALARGVLLDVGHGSGSFSFPAVEAWARANKPQAFISTDLHSKSVLGPAYDLGTVMTKMLTAGFSVESVLRSVTSLPLGELGLDAEVQVGAAADLAVISLKPEPLSLFDSRGVERKASQRFQCELTIVSGAPKFVHPSLRLVAG